MSETLYQQEILDLARAAHGAGRLAEPEVTVTLDNPLCGDRVTVDLHLADGRIAALGHRVRGCTLCEAAASAIGRHAQGAGPGELAAGIAAARAVVAGETADPLWPELRAFRPVSAVKSRHRCVLLPFDALARALAEAAAGSS